MRARRASSSRCSCSAPSPVKGQIGGIGTRPRLRAQAADKKPLIDQTYTPDQVIDLPAAMHAAELAVCFALPLDQKNSIAKGASGVDATMGISNCAPADTCFLVPLRYKMPPAQGGQIGVSFVLDSLGQLRLFPTYRFVGYQ